MTYQEIRVYLDKLIDPEYEEYFLIFTPKGHGDVYVQLIKDENNELYCEVVSNQNLPDRYKLDSSQIDLLGELGFSMDKNDINHNRTFKANTEILREEIAKLVLKIFTNIFGLNVSGFDITFDS